MANVLPGCSTMGTVTAGPVFSYSATGFGYGWSVNGGFTQLASTNGPPGHLGAGLTLGVGQTWRQAENVASPAAQVPPSDGASNAPAPRRDALAIELLTYFDLGLSGTSVESPPSYAQVSLSVGPAWSSRSESPNAGLMLDLAPSAAFVPAPDNWPSCSGNGFNLNSYNSSGPAFVAILGVRRLYGSWEIYASPQIGFVRESVTCD